MQYFGGKNRIGEEIAAVIQPYINKDYIEPFCGMYGVGRHIQAKNKYAYDINLYLIKMLQELQQGRIYPSIVTEDDYQFARLNKDIDPALSGFIGFACSFAAKWFGGYARGKYNYAETASNQLNKLKPLLEDVAFAVSDYKDIVLTNQSVIYCDPPYDGTYGFKVGSFDSQEFIQQCKAWHNAGHTVFVSEYDMPEHEGFNVVWKKAVHTEIRTKTGRSPRVEKLYLLES